MIQKEEIIMVLSVWDPEFARLPNEAKWEEADWVAEEVTEIARRADY